MSTKVKEALFELIKSLSKSEKRYFKLQSSMHTIGEENNYVRLFDYIDKLDVYDEDQLFLEFKGEAFLNRFSITKKRLYDHILDSLDLYHASNSIDAQLHKMLHSADILYSKSLYEQCKRILRSTEKLAEKHERSIVLLEVQKRTRKLIENTGYTSVDMEELSELYTREKNIISALEINGELWQTKSQLFQLLSKKGKARTSEEVELFKQIVQHLPKHINLEILPFETIYLYNHIYSAYYFAIGEIEKSYEYLGKNLSLFEKNENDIKENLNTYFSLLTNAIYVSEKLGFQTQTNELLKKLKLIPHTYNESQTEDQRIKLFGSTASIELSILANRGDFDSCLKQIPIIEQGLKMYGSHLSPNRKAFIEFKIATIYLSVGEFSKALSWVNSILNQTEMDKNEDIFSCTQILDLLIHLELKHTQLLPYSLKNAQRFLKSRNRLHSFEKVFLQFISKRIKVSNPFEGELLWESLFDSLSQIKEDDFESIALEYFDFATWAESKTKRIPFKELIVQKMNIQTIRKKSA